MTAVLWITGLLLAVAAVLAVVRAEKGPSMLDRTAALDVFTSIVLAGVALHVAWTRKPDLVPVLLALALVGFISSVTVARFAAVEPEGEGRVLTREEADALEAAARVQAEEQDRSFDEEHHGGPAEGEVGR